MCDIDRILKSNELVDHLVVERAADQSVEAGMVWNGGKYLILFCFVIHLFILFRIVLFYLFIFICLSQLESQ